MKEFTMKLQIGLATLGTAIVLGGASAAHAQMVVAPAVVTPPLQTVQTTTETVRTTRLLRPVRGAPRHQVVTTRTVTRSIVPTSAVVAPAVAAAPQPLYDVAAPAPVASSDDDYYYSRPLYDVAAPAPAAVIGAAPAVPVTGFQPFIYHYVYQPDRILVVDPTTGVAVQALPR
jgi:hypothetical protein